MLDRYKLSCALEKISLFSSQDRVQLDLAFGIWGKISQDKFFKDSIERSQSSFLLPDWAGNLSDIIAINPKIKEYSVLAVDGSQIYPDRHIGGVSCYLINIGGCLLEYGAKGRVSFFSEPFVFTHEQETLVRENYDFFSPERVDLCREEFELTHAYKKSCEYLNNNNNFSTKNFVCLMDGSLIFWYLEGKSGALKEYYLKKYIEVLQDFYEREIIIAGYISMPKSKELINLIKIGLCRFPCANCISCHSEFNTFPCRQVDLVLDTQLCSCFLKEFERTTVFYSNSHIVSEYPGYLKPCFFYLNVGSEIIRVEIPMWVTHKENYITQLCYIIIDQVQKGYGYPVVLSESHEQAVVNSADREFFYHLLQKNSIEAKRHILMSPKGIKKKGLGV
jgi:hypothetical protein